MHFSLQELSYVAPLLPYTDEVNFLAHLHLATLAHSSMLGNLMADFVRGDPEGLYSPAIVAGIRMHRRIDILTDSHEAVKQVRTLFSLATRLVAPIALDVVWDHFSVAPLAAGRARVAAGGIRLAGAAGNRARAAGYAGEFSIP